MVADFDGNGNTDLFLPGVVRSRLYLQSEPGALIPATASLAGLPLSLSSGGAAADYDGDGDLDLFVTRFLAPDVLLRNDGDGWTDVSLEAGIIQELSRSVASSWADYDLDGDLDLFVGGYGWIDEDSGDHEDFGPAQRAYLYQNDGGGGFVDVGGDLPQAVHDGYTLAGGFHDLNRDGWQDLYIVNDFGMAYPNVLLWNRQGSWEADANHSGLDLGSTGMGLGVGDLNGDQMPDLLMPQWDGLNFYLSGRHDTWFNWSLERGVVNDLDRDQKIGWGTAFADLDNDGDIDIPVMFGHLESTYDSPLEQPDALFVQQEDGHFIDEAVAWGLDDRGVGRAVLAVDLNEDGWVDLIKRELGAPARLYVARCGSAAWVKVRLSQPGNNPDAIGARVTVVAGEQRWERWIRAGGSSYASAGPPEVHVGLGDVTRVDRIVVTWPDRTESVVDAVDARQILTITRTSP